MGGLLALRLHVSVNWDDCSATLPYWYRVLGLIPFAIECVDEPVGQLCLTSVHEIERTGVGLTVIHDLVRVVKVDAMIRIWKNMHVVILDPS